MDVKFLEKPLDKYCDYYRRDAVKFISGVAVTSVVLKDGAGCYLYVNQSLHNKKIPEDKRKFVAALDLTNGGLMILTQILMFLTISSKKCQDKMFNSMFGKYFDKTVANLCKESIKLKNKIKPEKAAEFEESFAKSFEGLKGGVKGAFSFLTSMVAATILAKRVLVPFIATPLASKAEALMDKNKKGSKAKEA